MPMFRKPRRQRQSGSGDNPAGPPSRLRMPELGDRLRELVDGAPAPEEALEPVLAAILEATGTRAGAICLFDARQNVLRLATEVGLSDEGCRTLRNVRRGDPQSWDMPLHGLLNRRAYLIESAARNRYVPRLFDHIGAVRTVACIPIYGGGAPLGSLVLVAVAPRSFGERDIRDLERPLRQLGRVIEMTRRQVASAAPAPRVEYPHLAHERDRLLSEVASGLAERARLSAELASRSGECDRLHAALDAAAEEHARLVAELDRTRIEAERIEGLGQSLSAADRERARLAATLETMVAERGEQTRRLAVLEHERAAAERAAKTSRAEVDALQRAATATAATIEARAAEHAEDIRRLQARIAEVETGTTELRERAREQERERARLAAELAAAGERERRLREEITAIAQQFEGAGKEEIQRSLEAARGAEEARASAVADAEAARAELARAQTQIAALEDRATERDGESEQRAAAERAATAERQALAGELTEARAALEAAEGRLVTLDREVEALREERSKLLSTGNERESEAAGLAAHLETLAAAGDRLRARLAEVEAEREGVAAERGAAVAAQARLEEALAREQAERSRVGAALAATQAALDALQAEQARREADSAERVARAAEEIQQLVAERDRLAAERAATIAPAAVAVEQPAPAAPVEVVTVAMSAEGRSRPRDVEPGAAVVVVLDTEQAWEDVSADGHQVVVVAPGEDAVTRLADLAPRRIIANLAAAGVMETVIALRKTGSTTRVWGCIASVPGDRALGVGMVEPAATPLDPDAVVTMLDGWASKGTRVVTAGADVDVLMSLRQALTRSGMSVSMAWDGKQAADLLGVVRPEVVVVDLALTRRDGYAIVAALGGAEVAPLTILVPTGEDPASSFAATLTDPTHVGRAMPLDRMLADVLKRTESPPQRRAPHQKVRGLKPAVRAV
jgi:CheY-like chemotaxis protein